VVIDREIFYIGSFNFDPRSATNNTELGIIVFSPEIARQALTLLDGLKRERSHELRLGADGRRSNGLLVARMAASSSTARPIPAGGGGCS